MTKCAYCEYNDGMVYTSIPQKYKCTITNEFHLGDDDCNVESEVEFEPIKRGQWIRVTDDDNKGIYVCSRCGRTVEYDWVPALISRRYPYCHCGAKMGGGENGID